MGARRVNVLSLYPRRLPLRTRLFLSARLRLTPYEQIASWLPPRGRVLDLGCGHGLLTLMVAQQHPECSVLGIDHDPARIDVATKAARSVPNAQFSVGTLTAPPPGPFSGIALIDVLHYFPPEVQELIVREAGRRLDGGGTLLVREVDPEGGAAARWNRLYERLATGIGFTRTERGTHHFRSRSGWTELLGAAGLRVTAERCTSALFADVLYVGRRAPN